MVAKVWCKTMFPSLAQIWQALEEMDELDGEMLVYRLLYCYLSFSKELRVTSMVPLPSILPSQQP